ncbi:MAG: hypothetical protein HY721_26780, partial [Planctomycetes bacterium]|nr:hypothetical protein [Planctomycetota bacterium]
MQPLAALVLMAGPALAQDELRPGALAEVFAGSAMDGPPAARRAETDVHVDLEGASPDLRVPPGPFAVRWTARLLAPEDGTYRLAAFLRGGARVVIAGRVVLDSSRAEDGWADGEPVRLDYGEHPLAVELRGTEPAARLGLYWSS